MGNLLKKKAASLILGFMMVCSLLLAGSTPVKADSVLMHKIGSATANAPINYNFSMKKNMSLLFDMRLNERTSATITVKETGHDVPTATIVLASTDPSWQYVAASGIYANTAELKLASGDYILELRFENDVNYDMTVTEKTNDAKLKKNKITVTKGFTDSISVKNGKIKSCTSGNKSVATVSKKGVITGKKNGNATIKVKLTNGKTISCKVKIVSNQYSAPKITVDNSTYNVESVKAYQASFDKKGNLKVKFSIVNNSPGKIVNIKNFKIVAKNGKTYATYTAKNFKVSVDSFKDKTYSVTIAKSKLKMKQAKIDLRTSTIKITGKMVSDTM